MLDLLETRCSVWFAICCISHICMTDMTSLILFFLILFHYWAAFVVYQQNRVNNTTWNSLKNIFSVNHIQLGSFRGCSRIGVQKCPPPLKSVKHILQWWNLAWLYLTQRRFKTYINHVAHPLSFADISIFRQKSATLVISRNTDIGCILIHSCYFF